MKLLIIILSMLPLGVLAQKKLPISCTELKTKLQEIKRSYNSFEKWGKQLVSTEYEKKYSTNFTLCDVPAFVEIYGDNNAVVELVFDFKGYQATNAEREAFVKKLSTAISEVFTALVYRTRMSEGEESDDTYYHYWNDHRLGRSTQEEVELKYPGLGSPLQLRFIRKKN